MPKLRIGLIGTGIIARAHAAGIVEAGHSVLSAVCDVQPEQTAHFLQDYAALAPQEPHPSVYIDYRVMLREAKLDAVIVATPVCSHKEIAVEALRAGLHVLCEKPAAMNAAEAEEMRQAARQAGTVACMGFAFRCIPAVDFIRDLVADNTLGPLHHFRGYFYANRLAPADHCIEWRHRLEEAGSGVIGDLASHVYDMYSYLAEPQMGRVARVAAQGGILVPKRPDASGVLREVTTEETLNVWMKTQRGGEITIEASRYSPFEFGFQLSGTKGALKYSNYRYSEIELITYAREGVYSQNKAQKYLPVSVPERYCATRSKDRFVRQYLMFEQAVLGNAPVKADFETGWENQRMMDAMQLSLRQSETAVWQAVSLSDT